MLIKSAENGLPFKYHRQLVLERVDMTKEEILVLQKKNELEIKGFEYALNYHSFRSRNYSSPMVVRRSSEALEKLKTEREVLLKLFSILF